MKVLLSKSEVDKRKALDRQREVEEGIKIAKRVDTLREVAAHEETSLTKFRVKTVEAIQAEIDEKIAERNQLENSNRSLREERIRLEGPLNLVQEWERVKEDKTANERWSTELVNREVVIAAKADDVRKAESEFVRRETDIAKRELWANDVVNESHLLHKEAKRVSSEADDKLRRATNDINERYTVLDEKESRFRLWEERLDTKEAQLKLEEETIISGMKFIADRRKTLERGFAELKRKQHG